MPRGSGERLKEALAESTADRIVEMVWKMDDSLSDGQIADLAASLPDSVKTLVQGQLNNLARPGRGFSSPVASFGADVTATLVLSPVLKPVEDGLPLEVVGIVTGLVTGLHPLVITCAKYLAHDELGSMLATAIKRAMKSPSAQTFANSVAADHEAVPAREGLASQRLESSAVGKARR